MLELLLYSLWTNRTFVDRSVRKKWKLWKTTNRIQNETIKKKIIKIATFLWIKLGAVKWRANIWLIYKRRTLIDSAVNSQLFCNQWAITHICKKPSTTTTKWVYCEICVYICMPIYIFMTSVSPPKTYISVELISIECNLINWIVPN